MSLNADQMVENVSAQIRTAATQRRMSSPSPTLPLCPQAQAAVQVLAIELPDFAPQSSGVDLARQVEAEIRDRAARDRQSKPPSPSTRHTLITASPTFTDGVIQRTFSENSNSTEGSELPVDDTTTWFGAFVFAAFAALFAFAAVKYEGYCTPLVKIISIFFTIASGSASTCIISELLSSEPAKTYRPTRLLLKDLKIAVAEGEKHQGEFAADMDTIVKLDKRVRRMARAGAILMGSSDWQRWQEVRNRIFALEHPLPRVDWKSEPSP